LPEAQILPQLRAGIARATRKSQLTGDPSPAVEARRDYAAAKIEDYVRRVVDQAPPLTEEQRNRLTAILRAPGGGGHAAG
jgi:hypothetical protein